MNAIGGFFAPLNGFLLAGYPAKMRNRQKQETPRTSLGDGPKTLARDRSPAPWSLPRASRSMVPNLDFSPYELVKKIDMARHSPSSRILQHPAPVPCVIAVDRRVWLARAPACLPFVQRDDALPSGMRRIDAAIRRDMRDRLDSRGNLHLRPPGSVAWSEFRLWHACTSAGLRSRRDASWRRTHSTLKSSSRRSDYGENQRQSARRPVSLSRTFTKFSALSS
jgi:hypothetical protein